jgi:hypothetical protein
MTEKELKEYATIGLLVRINADKEQLTKITEPRERERVAARLERMQKHYESLLDDLRQYENPAE